MTTDDRVARDGVRALLAVLVGLAVLWALLTYLWQLALMVIVAGAVYYLFAPVVDLFERRGLPRVLSTALSFATLLFGIGVALSALVPRAYAELESLAADLPRNADELERRIAGIGIFGGPESQERVRAALHGLFERADEFALGAVTYTAGAIAGVVGSLLAIVFGLVAGFYLLLGAPSLRRETVRWLPPASRERWLRFGHEASNVLAGYLRARLLASVFVGTAYGIAFHLLGIEEALLLGVVGGILNFVPVVGPLLAAIPALAVAAFDGWPVVVGVLVVMVVAQQIESAVLNPQLEGHYVRLHPAIVVLAAGSGAALAGVAGLLLATPAAGLARVVLEVFYRDRLPPEDGVAPPLRERKSSVTLAP